MTTPYKVVSAKVSVSAVHLLTKLLKPPLISVSCVSLTVHASGTHLQGPEQVRVRGLSNVGRSAIGKHQLESPDRVDSQTVLVRLERVACT